MKNFARPIIGPAVAVSIIGTMISAAGSVAAGSHDKNAAYPPVPQVNKNTAIPQKNSLTDRRALAPKLGAGSGNIGGNTGVGKEGPRLGVERVLPERQIPDEPIAATKGPAGGKGPAGSE